MFTSSLLILFYSHPSFAFLFPCSYTSPNKGVSWFPASPYPSNYLTHWKKKNLPPGIKLYWMLLPIRSGRLTIKIPDKGIKVYVRQRSVWEFSCRKVDSTWWCCCKAACKLSIFCCLQIQRAELPATTNWLKTTQVSDLKCFANPTGIFLYSEDSNINK